MWLMTSSKSSINMSTPRWLIVSIFANWVSQKKIFSGLIFKGAILCVFSQLIAGILKSAPPNSSGVVLVLWLIM